MITLFEALKNFKIVHTVLTLFIVSVYAFASLSGNPGADNFKELAFISVTFWFSSDSVDRAIRSVAQMGVQSK